MPEMPIPPIGASVLPHAGAYPSSTFTVPAFFDYAATREAMWRERSVQRVLEILYLKCERSDENEPLLRRRELLEKQGQRFGLRQIRRAVERGELPARLDVELASIYLQSLWDGICGTLAWTERLRDDPWNRAERMFRAGLDSLRSSPYLLLADA